MHSGANPNLYNSAKDTSLHCTLAGKASPELLADFITLGLALPSPNTLNVLLGAFCHFSHSEIKQNNCTV